MPRAGQMGDGTIHLKNHFGFYQLMKEIKLMTSPSVWCCRRPCTGCLEVSAVDPLLQGKRFLSAGMACVPAECLVLNGTHNHVISQYPVKG